MLRASTLVFAAAALAACGTSDEAPVISAEEIAEHTRHLASDELLGRAPGQPGGEAAAEYIAEHFASLGLEAPGGSHLQRFPIIGNAPDPASARLVLEGAGGRLTPAYLDDFVLNPGDAEATSAEVEAELVFAGYGIDAPEYGWNDFAGADVAGKVILVLVNDPPAPPEEPDLFGGVAMTYYGRWTYKYEEAARQGAAGVLVVHETEPAGYPWSVVRGGFSGEQFSLPADPSAPPPATVEGWVSLDLARAALAAGGLDFDELKARAAERGFTAMPTGVTVRASLRSGVRSVETSNVAGLLRGSERPDEVIVVTAHYDHFGVGEPIDGDSIYNGAYDNASGTGLLMAMATTAAGLEPAPARSILFLATGAEEQGLLGAEWYVQSPLLPLDHTVAVLNFDGANLWGETTDVTVQGEERGELGAYVRPRAEQLGLTIVPDPEPENGYFFRSDHFPFAKAGVPALYIEHGHSFVGRPEGWGDSIRDEYTALHYHQPSDEMSDEFVFDGAVQQGTLGLLTLLDIAADSTWPNWHEGQEFKAARDAMMAGR
ncbi:MAG TPA: M28 family peptidase [Longimicrobiales bacterium]|nr:M28 family peptidase [Longimicrobiales bacterium]